MTAPHTVLLDLDGTLTDNFTGIARCIRFALEALDGGTAAIDDVALRAYVGPPLRHSFARLLDTADAARVEQALASYRARYRTVGWQENVAYEGILEALVALREHGHLLYLCTSKPQPFAERIVGHFGIAPHLAGIYGADLEGTLDDKARLMQHLIAQEALDPRRTVMVGDRRYDIAAARANGVRTIGVLWGYGTREELVGAGADVVVGEPSALLAAVQGPTRPGAALPTFAPLS